MCEVWISSLIEDEETGRTVLEEAFSLHFPTRIMTTKTEALFSEAGDITFVEISEAREMIVVSLPFKTIKRTSGNRMSILLGVLWKGRCRRRVL